MWEGALCVRKLNIILLTIAKCNSVSERIARVRKISKKLSDTAPLKLLSDVRKSRSALLRHLETFQIVLELIFILYDKK